MAQIPAVVREFSVVMLAIFVVVTFTGGAATHAVLTDTETSDTETISLAKKNQGAVTFTNCRKVDFEPNDPSNFVVNATTNDPSRNIKTYNFTDADFTSSTSYTLQTGKKKKLDQNDEIRQITLDGVTYDNPNYPGGC